MGVGDFTQVDTAWMRKVLEVQGVGALLERAEKLLSPHTDFASIQYGIAAFMRILEQEAGASAPSSRGLMPGSATANPAPSMHRKQQVARE